MDQCPEEDANVCGAACDDVVSLEAQPDGQDSSESLESTARVDKGKGKARPAKGKGKARAGKGKGKARPHSPDQAFRSKLDVLHSLLNPPLPENDNTELGVLKRQEQELKMEFLMIGIQKNRTGDLLIQSAAVFSQALRQLIETFVSDDNLHSGIGIDKILDLVLEEGGVPDDDRKDEVPNTAGSSSNTEMDETRAKEMENVNKNAAEMKLPESHTKQVLRHLYNFALLKKDWHVVEMEFMRATFLRIQAEKGYYDRLGFPGSSAGVLPMGGPQDMDGFGLGSDLDDEDMAMDDPDLRLAMMMSMESQYSGGPVASSSSSSQLPRESDDASRGSL